MSTIFYTYFIEKYQSTFKNNHDVQQRYKLVIRSIMSFIVTAVSIGFSVSESQSRHTLCALTI